MARPTQPDVRPDDASPGAKRVLPDLGELVVTPESPWFVTVQESAIVSPRAAVSGAVTDVITWSLLSSSRGSNTSRPL